MRIDKEMTDYAKQLGLEWQISKDGINYYQTRRKGQMVALPFYLDNNVPGVRVALRHFAYKEIKEAETKYHGAHLCENCGCKFDDHMIKSKVCPPIKSYGNPLPFPKLTQVSDPDKSLAVYWGKSSGHFSPKR